MDSITNVKMALNESQEVVVAADVNMKNKKDIDDLYFVMFNILSDPLRFSVCTTGDFTTLIAKESAETNDGRWHEVHAKGWRTSTGYHDCC